MRIASYICLSSCLLTSCMVGPDFTKPESSLPASWATALPPKSNLKDLTAWWTIFGDPQLNRLVAQAESNNPDMKMALMRVQEARSSARIAGASLLPSSSAGFGAGRGTSDGWGRSSSSSFSLNADVSWELDVFGGNRRTVEAAMASLLSTEANALSVKTALMAEVATTYFSWIASVEELRVAREQLELQKKTLDIVTRRKNAELASSLDLEQARSQVASTEGNIPVMEANMKEMENTLSVLLGSYLKQGRLTTPSLELTGKLPTVPIGLPSELLRRRPDIIGAEADLHAAVANVGVAVSDLYPRFSLTGSASSGARSFDDVFRSHSANWSLGSNVSQPLFRGGELRERVKMQKVAAERAGEAYRKVLITAVSEVESALIDYASSKERLSYLIEQNESNKKAAKYSLDLYTAGQTDFLNVVTAQSSWLQSEVSIVSMRQNIRKSVVKLALALGGGW
ncbi:TolC family protein [Akkermansia sp. N21169]|uniref:TolC family protein n=1 Tax=unclassified Akkermansia TaxID=2608915 RepID=UPI00244EB4A8|nr:MULTISPECIES: TolC family protein [unclassified Akkermansia]MDH3068947.1 TolC family protein [Akkermansia sp. N21169]WPX39330.1 TolC family protein [Akkermansia sp. N21116]